MSRSSEQPFFSSYPDHEVDCGMAGFVTMPNAPRDEWSSSQHFRPQTVSPTPDITFHANAVVPAPSTMGERHIANDLPSNIFSGDVGTTYPDHSFDLRVHQYDYLDYSIPVDSPAVIQQEPLHMPWMNTAPTMSYGASASLSSGTPPYGYDHWQSLPEAQWTQRAQQIQNARHPLTAQKYSTVHGSYATLPPRTTQQPCVARQPAVVNELDVFTRQEPMGLIGSLNNSGLSAYNSEADDGKLPSTCKQKGNKANDQVEHGPTTGTRGVVPTTAENPTNAQVATPLKLNEHGMYFDDLEEASSKLHGLTWPPRLDMTLPASAAARREIVKELVAAMNDMSDYQDKVGSVFKKQWLPADGEATNDHFSPQSKEKKCWEILVRPKILRDLTDLIVLTLHVACARTNLPRRYTFYLNPRSNRHQGGREMA
jgi:hypothetical protein